MEKKVSKIESVRDWFGDCYGTGIVGLAVVKERVVEGRRALRKSGFGR